MNIEFSRIEAEIASIVARHEYKAYTNAVVTCAIILKEEGYIELSEHILAKMMFRTEDDSKD